MSEKVLVVDDEFNITQLVAMALRYEGFEPLTAATGREARERIDTGHPDLMILDVGLPDQDGFSLIQRIRAEGHHLPVIFLTARDATEQKIRGLTLGGDDYVTKPFSVEELMARIRVVLRRHGGGGDAPSRLVMADLELDEESHEVRRDGRLINLTQTEFRLLRYLMINGRRVLSRAQILDHVWNYSFDGDGSVLETYISYLRRKVDTVDPRLIHTVRGVGYVLRVDASQ